MAIGDHHPHNQKETVQYRQHQKCGSCDHFQLATGSCDLVDGNISAENVCNLWEIKAYPKYRDKDFFIDEYRKKAG